MKIIPFIIIFTICFQFLKAQEEPMHNLWIELGSLSFSPTKYDQGVGVNISFKQQLNRLLTSFHYHDYVDRELANGGWGLFTSSNHYHAANLMAGITNKRCNFGHASASTGLGMFWGDIRNENFTTIGWPIMLASSVNLFPYLGLNLKLFANINSKHTLIGFGMDIQLGKLKHINF